MCLGDLGGSDISSLLMIEEFMFYCTVVLKFMLEVSRPVWYTLWPKFPCSFVKCDWNFSWQKWTGVWSYGLLCTEKHWTEKFFDFVPKFRVQRPLNRASSSGFDCRKTRFPSFVTGILSSWLIVSKCLIGPTLNKKN